jgi:hypothetical protein
MQVCPAANNPSKFEPVAFAMACLKLHVPAKELRNEEQGWANRSSARACLELAGAQANDLPGSSILRMLGGQLLGKTWHTMR